MNYFSTPISHTSFLWQNRLNCAQKKTSPESSSSLLVPVSIRSTSWNHLVLSSLTVGWQLQLVRWHCAELAIIIWVLDISHLLTLDVPKTVQYWCTSRQLQLNPIWSTDVYNKPQRVWNSFARVVLQQLKQFYELFIGCPSNSGFTTSWLHWLTRHELHQHRTT